jgi:hypothetical protein
MAGDWIKFEIATPDKPEVWVIASEHELDPDAVVGKLLRLWVWFDQHTEDGNAASVTKSLLDRLVGVSGFCDSVIRAGWMAESSGVVSLPNFGRHNGKTAKNRALTAKRVAIHKAASRVLDSTNAKSNAPLTQDALPREEKRREENKKTPCVCPHDQIIELWSEILPSNPQPRTWGDDRKKLLRTRWRESKDRQNLEWWRGFFNYISQSDFLTGKKTDFTADLPWCLQSSKFAKIIDGNYENKTEGVF